MLAFRDHKIITTSSNKTESNVTYTNRLLHVHAHNDLEANIIRSKKVIFVFSYERSGLVALFTGVNIHVYYAWLANLRELGAIEKAGLVTL